MDDRIREHATVLDDWSARIGAGDNVVLSVVEDAHDLAVAAVVALDVGPHHLVRPVVGTTFAPQSPSSSATSRSTDRFVKTGQ